jgi:hypothetical protein
MATVSLTLAKLSTPSSQHEFYLWAGTQSIIGNLIRCAIPIDWRIVNFLQIQMAGTDTATPGGSGILSVNVQLGDVPREFVCGGRFFSNGASIAAAGATYAWLRGTVSPNILSASGAMFRVCPWGDTGTPLNEQNDGIMGSNIIINYECSSLTGVAAVTMLRVGIGYRL